MKPNLPHDAPAGEQKRLTKQLDRVRAHLLNDVGALEDGSTQWWTLAELEKELGFPQASISARLRDLRSEGYVIETKVREGVAARMYRLLVPPAGFTSVKRKSKDATIAELKAKVAKLQDELRRERAKPAKRQLTFFAEVPRAEG